MKGPCNSRTCPAQRWCEPGPRAIRPARPSANTFVDLTDGMLRLSGPGGMRLVAVTYAPTEKRLPGWDSGWLPGLALLWCSAVPPGAVPCLEHPSRGQMWQGRMGVRCAPVWCTGCMCLPTGQRMRRSLRGQILEWRNSAQQNCAKFSPSYLRIKALLLRCRGAHTVPRRLHCPTSGSIDDHDRGRVRGAISYEPCLTGLWQALVVFEVFKYCENWCVGLFLCPELESLWRILPGY